MGRILLHGFLLCSYIPITLNNALLYFLFIGNEPLEVLSNSSFLHIILQDEKIALENGINSEVTEVKIASLFNQFDSNVIPSASNFGSVVSTYPDTLFCQNHSIMWFPLKKKCIEVIVRSCSLALIRQLLFIC